MACLDEMTEKENTNDETDNDVHFYLQVHQKEHKPDFQHRFCKNREELVKFLSTIDWESPMGTEMVVFPAKEVEV